MTGYSLVSELATWLVLVKGCGRSDAVPVPSLGPKKLSLLETSLSHMNKPGSAQSRDKLAKLSQARL